MHEVPGAEPHSGEDYPSEEGSDHLLGCRRSTSRSRDTTITSDSSSGSGDIVILSTKSPLIIISEDSHEATGDKLVEVPEEFDGFDDDSDFQSPPHKKGATVRTKAETERSRSQKRYDRHRKFQTLWAAKLPWAKGIMATNDILQMVCYKLGYKVCSSLDRKPCIMAPKSHALFKHDGKRTSKKDMPQYKVKAGETYIAT